MATYTQAFDKVRKDSRYRLGSRGDMDSRSSLGTTEREGGTSLQGIGAAREALGLLGAAGVNTGAISGAIGALDAETTSEAKFDTALSGILGTAAQLGASALGTAALGPLGGLAAYGLSKLDMGKLTQGAAESLQGSLEGMAGWGTEAQLDADAAANKAAQALGFDAELGGKTRSAAELDAAAEFGKAHGISDLGTALGMMDEGLGMGGYKGLGIGNPGSYGGSSGEDAGGIGYGGYAEGEFGGGGDAGGGSSGGSSGGGGAAGGSGSGDLGGSSDAGEL